MHEEAIVRRTEYQKSNLEIVKKKNIPVPIEDETKDTASNNRESGNTTASVDTTITPVRQDSKAGDSSAGASNASDVLSAEVKKQSLEIAMDVDDEERSAAGKQTTDADGDTEMEDEEEGDEEDEEEKKSKHDGVESIKVRGAAKLKEDKDEEYSSSTSNGSNGVPYKKSEKIGGKAKGSLKDVNGNNSVSLGDEKKDDNTKVEKFSKLKNSDDKKDNEKASGNGVASFGINAAPAAPPPPVMKGTLSIDLNPQRRHLIRGMWNYEHSTTFPPQRFELIRNLGPDEDTATLPVDGEFHGSFSLAYFHTTSKGKQKERSKVISESGVNIKFTKLSGSEAEYQVDGTGTNQFGIFSIIGTATPSTEPGDPTMNIVFRKRYDPGHVAALSTDNGALNVKKPDLISDADPTASGPLPEPAKSFPSGVVSLRGNLYKEESNDLGSTEVVHRVNGMWASGLDFILADPQNVRGMCNRFEYEHKSMVPTQQFPVSGKYSGWFDLSNEDGTRTRINERDVTLKFRLNNVGYHNIEGKGSNVFGKYTITGTLTADNVITIFRHFQPRKLKKSSAPLPAAAASEAQIVDPSTIAPITTSRRPSMGPLDVKLSLDDVNTSSVATDAGQSKEIFDPITPPAAGTYSAVSRGVLRVNDDGSHSCQGKWAETREAFTNGQTKNFTFRLEPHFAAEAAEVMKVDRGVDKFPLDSAMYKGSFQLKKQGSRYQTIVDNQIVMKFRKNKQGAFNVHGTGVNAVGEFNLRGTLVTSGKTGGQVELYRMYPPEKLAAPPVVKPVIQKLDAMVTTESTASTASVTSTAPPSGPGNLQRRESSRMVKLPSRLEEDDPNAQLSRTMDKCSQILKFMKEKDVELGAFFSEPVDPVALGIPTYFQVVKKPMDLRTIYRRMEAGEIDTPEDFARLVRLVFENAMTFNIDPAHSVHQAARSLLVMFNQKFRDVERMVQSIRRTHGIDVDEGKKKGKDDKKRKRQDELLSLKRIRFEEVQAMTSSHASAVAAIIAAAPETATSSVTRSEFNLLLQMVQQLQTQIVLTHSALAELSPSDLSDADVEGGSVLPSVQSYVPPKLGAPAVVEKKKAVKRKSDFEESVLTADDSAPLSLEEQELLTETINEMPQEHLGGVIQIIREAAPVGADEDEIDLEIDQLDHRTQRKLLRHIQKVRRFVPHCLDCLSLSD